MQIVVDTNVFIDAIFHGRQDCLEILKKEHSGELFFVMSNAMSEELLKTVFLHAISLGCTLKDFQQPFLKICRALRRTILCEPNITVNYSTDPDDNKFIECAISGNVEYIISSDGHLLNIEQTIKTKNKKIIKIIKPSEFLNIHNAYLLQQHFKKS